MSNYNFTPSVSVITMPSSYEASAWKMFFSTLSELEYTAPLYTILSYAQFLWGLEEKIPPTVFSRLYYNLALELAADDRFPAMDAATEVGFCEAGFRQLIHAASLQSDYRDTFVDALRVLVRDEAEWFKQQGLYEAALEVLGKVPIPIEQQQKIGDLAWWTNYFQRQMELDACAPTSILEYFLADQNPGGRIFCPLGYDEYQHVGEELRTNSIALEASIKSGLMVSAVRTYFGAVLDVVENWNVGCRGAKYLMEHERLSEFVPFYDRYVAKGLLNKFGTDCMDDSNEDSWCAKSHELHEFLRNRTYLGY